jgi:hypothetical protein
VLEVVIVFGYKDARPVRFVSDRYERNYLVAQLLKPCQQGREDCGFQRGQSDGELFIKSFTDATDCRHQVQMKIVSSSVGPDDEVNRKDPLQVWRSDWSENTFLEGLARARVIFYSGHSRDGGGPDFHPPRIVADGHVQYSWYRRHRPGVVKMAKALRGSEKSAVGNKLIGLFSCESDQLKLHGRSYRSVDWLTTSGLVYAFDSFESMRSALSDWLRDLKDQ